MNELIEKYVEMWKRGADFEGTSDVKSFWYAFLTNWVIGLVLGFVLSTLKLGFISYLYSLAALIPSLALTIRRMRDTGREWYWIFINFIPCIGTIWMLILLSKPTNSYQR